MKIGNKIKRCWKKGKGKYPASFWKIKEKVMERDNKTCQICGIKVFYSVPFSWFTSVTLEHFVVHHIDLNKSNNKLDNLIFVCTICHGYLHRKMNAEYKKELLQKYAMV